MSGCISAAPVSHSAKDAAQFRSPWRCHRIPIVPNQAAPIQVHPIKACEIVSVPFEKERCAVVGAPRCSSSDFTGRSRARDFHTKVLTFRAETTMKKKILVTGATGYLGGRLCAALLSQGHSVRALARLTSDLSSLPRHGNLELVYGDVTDYTSLLNAVSGCHVIFHAAAVVETWLADPSRFFAVNVGGLENVLRAVKETNTVERIIYTSSFFALGPTDGHVADESQVHHEKFFCTEYERSKVITDKIALRAASEGLPIVLVYPGMIYGPGKLTSGNALAKILIERFNGRLPGYIGNASDRCSYTHVDDVVEGHIAAMDKGRVDDFGAWMAISFYLPIHGQTSSHQSPDS